MSRLRDAGAPDPDHLILRAVGALAELANARLILPWHARELHRIAEALAPAAAATRKMRIVLDELAAEAQETVEATERGAAERIARLGCPALTVVTGGARNLEWRG